MTVIKPVIRAAVLLSMMGAMNALLGNVQVEGRSTGTVESIASGLPDGVVERTNALLRTWAEDPAVRPLTSNVMGLYFLVDLVFIVVYARLAYTLWTRLDRYGTPTKDESVHRPALRNLSPRGRMRLIGVLVVADFFENTFRLWLFHQVDTPTATAADLLVRASYACTLVKFLVALLLVWVLIEWLQVPMFRTKLWLGLVGWLKAAWRMRVAVTAVTMFGAIFLFDATGQVTDLLVRWAEGGIGLGALGFAVGSAWALGLTAWLTTRRLVLDAWEQSTRNSTPSVLVSRVVSLVILLVGMSMLAAAAEWELSELKGPACVLFAIGLLGLAWELLSNRRAPDVITQWKQEAEKRRSSDAAAPDGSDIGWRVRALARGLAIVPFAVLAAAATRAHTPVPFVVQLTGGPSGFSRTVLLFAVLAAPLCTWAGWRFMKWCDDRWPASVKASPALNWWSTVIIGGALAGLGAVGWLGVAGDFRPFTAVTVLALFLTCMTWLLCELQRIAETLPVPAGLLVLGFSRTPVALLLVVFMVVSSLSPFDDGSAHAVRHNEKTPPQGFSVDDLWTSWKTTNCADKANSGEVLPLVLVASYGGGQRAAYWTSSTLTELFYTNRTTRKCPGRVAASSVFALGGASGGSLGNTAWVARRNDTNWYTEDLAHKDFLTEPFTWMLTVDLARSVIGYGFDDRAARLEKQFENAVPNLQNDFFTGEGSPLLVLTGTQVENGCRLNVSGTRLTTGGSCTDGETGGNAPITTDVLDYTCDPKGANPHSISRSTAALLSARFPYVSPSGQLYRCGDGQRVAVVDGGYSDNTGVDAMMALWDRLEPLVADHNRAGRGATVVPVFLVLDNHYRAIAKSDTPKRTQELRVPLNTKTTANGLDELASEQRARQAFSDAVPGSKQMCALPHQDGRFLVVRPVKSPGLQAPLAWALSELAVKDLDEQRDDAVGQAAPRGLVSWLAGTHPCRGSPRGAGLPS